ncbi:MAG: 2-hydroxy-3-oxopropionate reductase [Gemmatimonadetes bacterium]|nr:2-hydroxy-3-oxopropionate reductase [Gemmatimonadota bacterium]
MIAYFGTGLLGSSFVRAFLNRGEKVHIWNRSTDKARALQQYGAVAFDDPAEAARGAERIHLTLSDDAAVDDVLERTHPENLTIVDHTTTLPERTAAREKRWTERAIPFMHAPVFMGPPNALDASGVMLASGARERFDALAPHLEKMTGKLVYLGPDPARAAGIKLLGNQFIISLNAALSDTVTLAKGLGIPQDDVAHLFSFFNPGAGVPGRLKRMINEEFTNKSWPLAMARKDVRLMLEAAGAGGVELAVLPAIATLMDKWIAKGHADDDWMITVSDGLQ